MPLSAAVDLVKRAQILAAATALKEQTVANVWKVIANKYHVKERAMRRWAEAGELTNDEIGRKRLQGGGRKSDPRVDKVAAVVLANARLF